MRHLHYRKILVKRRGTGLGGTRLDSSSEMAHLLGWRIDLEIVTVRTSQGRVQNGHRRTTVLSSRADSGAD
jgi:hypothetical protein